jgi:hypothetical protein
MLEKEIEKPWAIISSWMGLSYIGRIIKKQSSTALFIQDLEDQIYPPSRWDARYIQEFKTSKEVEDYFWNNANDASSHIILDKKENIHEYLLSHFPKTMKQETLQTLHDILINYKTALSSS